MTYSTQIAGVLELSLARTTIVVSGALEIVLLQHVTRVNKVIASRTVPMTLLNVVVKVIGGTVIRSTPATDPMARTVVLVLLESRT